MNTKAKGNREGVADKNIGLAQEIVHLLKKRMLRDAWAFESLADLAFGTVDGERPPVDVNALLDAGLTAPQIVKKVREAYEDR